MDLGDRGHDVQQLLILGGDRLAAELVVDLHPVVVGRVVRGGHVHPAHGAQLADHEGQLRGGQEGAVVLAGSVR